MAKDSSFSAGTSEAMSRFHGNVRKAFTGYYRTRDFIRRVRACKTASDERALVAKESASIRDSFKSPAVGREQKYHSLSKLVYIYLLGYPSIFGQVECMKLAASFSNEPARYKDKRLGYLGVTLLSDEHQETLTLVTNSLKFDLNDSSEAIQALALSSLSLLASTGMARELATEVELLLSAPSSNIRKKAVGCATKLIQKDSELIEIFEPRLSALLNDKNHSVQLTSLTLFQTILALSDETSKERHSKLLPSLVKILQTLQTAPLDTEYDISGVSDPLLQINLLRTIRQLSSSFPCGDFLNDLLAQLATTLETSKNVGNAVLYEVVLTIMSIESLDQSLVNLAIGTLGKFLTGNSCGDNNLRYVALNLLNRILTGSNSTASTFAQIQKHQSTILACLHDADSTIRKKAADLSLLLMKSSSDLTQIAPALLDFCKRNAEETEIIEFKHEILTKLTKIIQKLARDPVIFLNLYISLLKQVSALHPAKNEIVLDFIKCVISRVSPVQIVRELYFSLTVIDEGIDTLDTEGTVDTLGTVDTVDIADTADIDLEDGVEHNLTRYYSPSSTSFLIEERINLPSDALLESSFWFFGEFGQIVPVESLCPPANLVQLLAAFLSKPPAPYALTALAKLSQRLPDQLQAIQAILAEATRFYKRNGQFELGDKSWELLKVVGNERISKIVFKPVTPEDFAVDCVGDSAIDIVDTGDRDITSAQSPVGDHTLATTPDTPTQVNITADLILGNLNVFIDQCTISSPSSLQLQLYFTPTTATTTSVTNITIALAVPRPFDFDYLAPASNSELSATDPLDRISLSIVLKRNKAKKDLLDLMDFGDDDVDEKEKVDWNADCKLKIKVNYTIDGKDFQQIGQLPKLLQ